MVGIEEIKPDNERNNRIIQKVLREIDMETAVSLCAKLKKDKDLVFRNLSERVPAQIKEELETREVSEIKQYRAYNLFLKKLSRYVEMIIEYLPPLLKQVYEKKYVQNTKIREIAAELSIPEGTVKYYLYLIRKYLKESL